MARANISEVKIASIALGGDGTMRSLRKKAFQIRDAAKEIYLADRVLPDHNSYLNSFDVYRSGNSYIIHNTDDTAFWVEFGAHAGGKTAVLGYAPLRRAVDVIASGE